MNTTQNRRKKLRATVGATLSLALLASPFGGLTTFAQDTEPRTVDIEVENHWVGTEAEAVDVVLYGNGDEVSRATLDDGDWHYVFEDVPQVQDNGLVRYSIEVSDLDHHRTHVSGDARSGFDVVHLEDTDSPTFEGTSLSIPVETNWIGESAEYADLALYVDGWEADRVRVDSETNWSHIFSNLPLVENSDGEPVTYTIEALQTPGYDTLIHGNALEGFVVSHIATSNAVLEGGVTARYVDEDGREIAYRVNVSGVLGADYEVSPKDIAGYRLVDTRGEEQGVFGLGITEVVYEYELEEEAEFVEGRIVAKYVDETGTEIALRDHYSGEIGTSYQIEPKEINGYELTGVVGDSNATYTHGVNEVVFEYVEAVDEQGPIMGSVVTKYVDRDGYEIADRERTSGEIGTHYDTVLKQIDGYGFVETRGAHEGDYAPGITIVEFVYDVVEDPIREQEEEIGQIIVRHMTSDGVQLSDSYVLDGDIGDIYEVRAETIDGYEWTRTIGYPVGLFEDTVRIVEFIYAPVEQDTPEEEPQEESDTPQNDEDEEQPVDEPVESDEDNEEPITDNDGNEDNNEENIEEDVTETPVVDEDVVTTPVEPVDNNNDNTNGTDRNPTNDNTNRVNAPSDDVTADGVSLANDFDLQSAYDKITFGMTYDEVVAIMGVDGVEYNSGELSVGEEVIANSDTYVWMKANGDGLGAGFIDGKAVSKSLVINGDLQSDYATGEELRDIMGEDFDRLVITQDGVERTDGTATTSDDVKVSITEADDEKKEGLALPDTATSTFNLLAIGAGLLVVAGGGLFFVSRRRDVSDTE